MNNFDTWIQLCRLLLQRLRSLFMRDGSHGEWPRKDRLCQFLRSQFHGCVECAFFFTSDRFGQCNEPRITILVLNPWLVRSSEWRENISPAYLDIRDLLSGFVNQHNGWISFVGLQRRFISTECKTAFDTFAFEEPIHLIRSVVSR